MDAAGPDTGVTPLDVVQLAIAVAKETLAVSPVKPVARVEDVVNQDTLVPLLMVSADAALLVPLAPVLQNVLHLVTLYALERTSVARPDTNATVTRLAIPNVASLLQQSHPRSPTRTPVVVRQRLSSHPLPLLEARRRQFSPQLPRPPGPLLPLRLRVVVATTTTLADLAVCRLPSHSLPTLSSLCSLVLVCSSTFPNRTSLLSLDRLMDPDPVITHPLT